MSEPQREANWKEVSSIVLPEEFMSPEQRLDAIAGILSTIALRSLKQSESGAERS